MSEHIESSDVPSPADCRSDAFPDGDSYRADAMGTVSLRGTAIGKATSIREEIEALGLQCEETHILDVYFSEKGESALKSLLTQVEAVAPGDVGYSAKGTADDGMLLIHDPDESERLIYQLYRSHCEHDFWTIITMFALEIAYLTSRRSDNAATLRLIKEMLMIIECSDGEGGGGTEEAKIARRMLAAAND